MSVLPRSRSRRPLSAVSPGTWLEQWEQEAARVRRLAGSLERSVRRMEDFHGTRCVDAGRVALDVVDDLLLAVEAQVHDAAEREYESFEEGRWAV